jgi:hypothetical protein
VQDAYPSVSTSGQTSKAGSTAGSSSFSEDPDPVTLTYVPDSIPFLSRIRVHCTIHDEKINKNEKYNKTELSSQNLENDSKRNEIVCRFAIRIGSNKEKYDNEDPSKQ